MTLTPLLNAPLEIQLHVLSALCAVVLGPIALLRRSRDIWHKRAGRAWVLAMLSTAITSFAILETRMIGPFSIIHGLSILTLWGLWQGVSAIRRGDIKRHQAEMRNLYFWAMGVAGLFTFLPGRRMNRVFFGDASEVGFVVAATLIGGALGWYAIQSRRAAI